MFGLAFHWVRLIVLRGTADVKRGQRSVDETFHLAVNIGSFHLNN